MGRAGQRGGQRAPHPHEILLETELVVTGPGTPRQAVTARGSLLAATTASEDQAAKAKELVALVQAEGVAYDFGSYRDAPSGIRLWGGATVDADDTTALLPWLDWAFQEIMRLP